MEKIEPIGKRLSPILKEIEETLWEHEATLATKPEFTGEGFRAAAKIFMAAMMDATFDFQQGLHKTQDEMLTNVEALGKEVRSLVFKYTGIDCHNLYKSDGDESN